ncbi:phosphomannomutase, partial [Streptomyces sp. WM6368]
MGGHTVPTVFEGLPLDVVPMYFELDGTFPNHEANPLDPKNIVDLQARVLAEGADLGIAFDGDADRCFIVDERGVGVSPSAITALVAARELARNGG